MNYQNSEPHQEKQPENLNSEPVLENIIIKAINWNILHYMSPDEQISDQEYSEDD